VYPIIPTTLDQLAGAKESSTEEEEEQWWRKSILIMERPRLPQPP
jgi:hypothetical protein